MLHGSFERPTVHRHLQATRLRAQHGQHPNPARAAGRDGPEIHAQSGVRAARAEPQAVTVGGARWINRRHPSESRESNPCCACMTTLRSRPPHGCEAAESQYSRTFLVSASHRSQSIENLIGPESLEPMQRLVEPGELLARDAADLLHRADVLL